jgi:spermidine/putrescine transport system substrate-binding protein
MTEPDIERFIADLKANELTRRRLLRQAGAGALGLSFASFLAACGGGSGIGASTGKEPTTAIPQGQISKTMTFSNWPLYIDVKGKSHPTLDKFHQKYGTNVKYVEEINDNVEFFGKVRQQYARGSSGGRDLHVVTDWLCARMKRLGYVQKLDKSSMPNVDKNIDPKIASPDFDPKREYSVPWQTGQVLLIYRKDKVGGDLTSLHDLFDPKFKGKVTFLKEMRDSVGSVLLMDGVKPEDASLDQVMKAIDTLQKASNDGQIRRFTGNDYTSEILRGDSVAILGWSGDAFQLESDNPNVKSMQPKEGFMVFTDSMQVPVGAPHAYTAEKFMDFVYQPDIAAEITSAVHYVPPVPAAKKLLEKTDPKIAQNPLVFPDLSRAHNFKTFSPNEEAQIDAAFQRAIGA